MGEGRRRGYNDFSLKMSSSLSKRWVSYVVKNLSRVFFSEWSLILLWVMRVYIIWVKGKKVTLKILQAECFTGTLQDGLSREALTKCNLALDSSTSNICFSHAFFAETSTRKLQRASCKTALIFILCSILHKLNTKPNTIKSHKIQENNLKIKRLFYFI